ncbi:Swt1 family HEPN domain-containing protein [Nocardioides sp. CPCC 206347]|uniref:Swt1 family HEPN domain-containing protein n=1 Tax=unclassified Nocardioides TaxID=2615069 RepID=UPI0036184D78
MTRALEISADALGPFVSRQLAPHVPAGMEWPSILRVLDEEKGNDKAGFLYAPSDLALQLRVMTERLGALGFPFSTALSRAEQNLAGELREVRNRAAHGAPFSFDDTYRALDTAERLLRAADQPAAADRIKAERNDLQRTQIEAETRRDVRESTSISGLGDVDLTPWREVLKPHPDVLSGRFKESEFAANLHSVAHETGTTSAEYSDPVEFFRRTFLTTGLKDLLTQAANRVAGGAAAAPVINLQTTFGGGKTHSMLAVWHLFSSVPSAQLPQEIQEILHSADLADTDRSIRRVAVVGNEIAAGQARERDGLTIRTLWGEIARQLGGKEAFDLLAESDANSTSPGDHLRDVLTRYSPCVILIDEWVAYARQLGDDDLPGGTFETQFTFAQLLTEAVAATPGALLLVSIPASDVRREQDGTSEFLASDLETGGERGRAALRRLEHVVGRVAHQWHPASAQESFEIVRRRLFEQPDAQAFRQVAATARKFVTFYREHQGEFPRETTEDAYEQKIRSAYPIHPELFARLYEDWSTLERFQRTRGVLRLMSGVVKELYAADDDSPLIMPGSVPIAADQVVGELTQYVDAQWRSVIDSDVDGRDSLPFQIDRERPLFGKRGLTRRIARATFLGSAATLQSAHKGIERNHIFLGVAMPGDTVGNFGSALQMLSDQATYLFSEGVRYWYDLQPSLNRTVNERAANLHEEDVWAEVVTRLKQAGQAGADFAGAIVAPEDTSDVPEAEAVRLVYAHPRFTHKNKDTDSRAIRFARDVVANRGSASRERRNTLVFLAADEQRYAELESIVRQHLAWRSVVKDKDHLDLTQQRVALASAKVDETNKVVSQRIGTSWIWALYPRDRGENEPFSISVVRADGDDDRLGVRTGKKLVKEDVLRVQIAPATIRHDLDSKLHRVWNEGRIRVGDLWDYYTKYPYLPRLRDKTVLVRAIEDAAMDIAWTQTGFALADDYDATTGDFMGLTVPLEDGPAVVTDDTYLVAPHVASAQRAREQAAIRSSEPAVQVRTSEPTSTDPLAPSVTTTPSPVTETSSVVERARYEGRYEVDASEPDAIAGRLREVIEEVLRHIVTAPGAENVSIVLEVSAENSEGFSEAVARTVRENSKVLGFDKSDFEDVEW